MIPSRKFRLHGLWTVEVERGLDTCEAIMANEEHKASEKQRKAKAKAKK